MSHSPLTGERSTVIEDKHTGIEIDTLLQLSLTKYANPEYYREFFDEFLQRSTHGKIRCSVSVTTNGGEL